MHTTLQVTTSGRRSWGIDDIEVTHAGDEATPMHEPRHCGYVFEGRYRVDPEVLGIICIITNQTVVMPPQIKPPEPDETAHIEGKFVMSFDVTLSFEGPGTDLIKFNDD